VGGSLGVEGSVVVHGVLADVVVVVHLAFIVFVGVGGLIAWRWPWVLWLHVPSVVWGLAIVTVGFTCPLTPLEKTLRRSAGEDGYGGGFVDRYIEGVVYPETLTPLLRAVAAVAVVAAYAGLYRRKRAARRSIGQLA
jgi:hypothetical protein